MKKSYNTILAILFTASGLGAGSQSYAQKKINWFATVGVGATDVRNFGSTLSDFSVSLQSESSSVSYQLSSAPNFLISGGLGVSGDLQKDGLLTWDAGLNIRTAGFKVKANLYELNGDLGQAINDNLPTVFDQWRNHRYWAAHVPLSINYLPFEVVGFTLGADLYYQFSDSPTTDTFPHGKLGQSMGFSSLKTPKYQHPLQFGGHIGVFVPIGEKLRLDLQFQTDVVSRLKVSEMGTEMNYREMGLMLNARYNLAW